MSCHFFLQGIFPTQELNPGLLHRRQMLYHLSHQGNHMVSTWTESAHLLKMTEQQEIEGLGLSPGLIHPDIFCLREINIHFDLVTIIWSLLSIGSKSYLTLPLTWMTTTFKRPSCFFHCKLSYSRNFLFFKYYFSRVFPQLIHFKWLPIFYWKEFHCMIKPQFTNLIASIFFPITNSIMTILLEPPSAVP